MENHRPNFFERNVISQKDLLTRISEQTGDLRGLESNYQYEQIEPDKFPDIGIDEVFTYKLSAITGLISFTETTLSKMSEEVCATGIPFGREVDLDIETLRERKRVLVEERKKIVERWAELSSESSEE